MFSAKRWAPLPSDGIDMLFNIVSYRLGPKYNLQFGAGVAGQQGPAAHALQAAAEEWEDARIHGEYSENSVRRAGWCCGDPI